MTQPNWTTVFCTDYSKLQIDQTGVYPPELTIAQERGGEESWDVYRICLDPCTETNNVLSDNSFHPNHPAWFAESLPGVAESCGTTEHVLISALCYGDPAGRAWAYECIGGYHGYDNFDSDPLQVTDTELSTILS